MKLAAGGTLLWIDSSILPMKRSKSNPNKSKSFHRLRSASSRFCSVSHQRSTPMKKFSEQLADLSVRAKHAEDAFSAAQKEAHDKIEVRKQKARADATTAVEKVNQKIKSANDDAVRDWNSVKAKVAADIAALKANVAEAKHNHDVKRADRRADRLEWEASFAIDYAIASVEHANLAVLDAIDGRVQAELAKQA